jgi:hypothetical protein
MSIENNTGDPRLDLVSDLLRRQLCQSPHMHLLDGVEVCGSSQCTEMPAGMASGPETVRASALPTGTPQLILGAITTIGNSYTLTLEVKKSANTPVRYRGYWTNNRTWPVFGSTRHQIPNGLLHVVRESATWIRRQIGESPADRVLLDAPPQDVTTDNWDALLEFVLAERFIQARDHENALLSLQNAIAADPDFTMAHIRMGDLLVSAGRYTEGYPSYYAALKEITSKHLTTREFLRLKGLYKLDTDDYDGALSIFNDYAALYPNDCLGFSLSTVSLSLRDSLCALAVPCQGEKLTPDEYNVRATVPR